MGGNVCMIYSILAICAGASGGALSRWLLGLQLNPLFSAVPLGTLAANLLGGYFVGVALSFFSTQPLVAPEWRLFVITGFLGGFTTFSTFSAEVVTLLQEGRFAWAAGAVSIHVLGSLLMTILGMFTLTWIRSL